MNDFKIDLIPDVTPPKVCAILGTAFIYRDNLWATVTFDELPEPEFLDRSYGIDEECLRTDKWGRHLLIDGEHLVQEWGLKAGERVVVTLILPTGYGPDTCGALGIHSFDAMVTV